MATREDVWREFGRAAELGQLIETELGTALLAHEAIKAGAHKMPVWDAARDTLDNISRNTLGRSIRQMQRSYNLLGDVGPNLECALEARNRMNHGFYLKYGAGIESPDGCDEMIAALEDLREKMWPGYVTAAGLADALLQWFNKLRDATD